MTAARDAHGLLAPRQATIRSDLLRVTICQRLASALIGLGPTSGRAGWLGPAASDRASKLARKPCRVLVTKSLADRPLRAVRIAVLQIAVFRGTVKICGMGTTDRPLRAVRIVVIAPARPADDPGVHVHRGEHQRAQRERQRDQRSRKIFHRFLLHLRKKTSLTGWDWRVVSHHSETQVS